MDMESATPAATASQDMAVAKSKPIPDDQPKAAAAIAITAATHPMSPLLIGMLIFMGLFPVIVRVLPSSFLRYLNLLYK